jgi:hypothetical protein
MITRGLENIRAKARREGKNVKDAGELKDIKAAAPPIPTSAESMIRLVIGPGSKLRSIAQFILNEHIYIGPE